MEHMTQWNIHGQKHVINGTYDTMEYTWTETCHNANHGYSSGVWSGCNNTNS